MWKITLLLFILSALSAYADTPPPGTVKAKMFSGDGNTSFTATGSSLNVNVTGSTGSIGTVNQGNAGSQSWLSSITASVLPTNACIETGGHLASIDSKLANPMPVTGTFWQATQPVSGTFWQSTQPVSAASLPLPTGAATSAKQPALGTAGSASTDVLTVQGITSMTPLKVDGSGVTQPVSGTFWQTTQPVSGTFWQATQPISGTVTATNSANGNTGSTVPTQATLTGGSDGANLRAFKVSSTGVLSTDGSATIQPVSGTFWQTTQPISAASLPLPALAATSTLQSTINTTLGSPFQAGGSIGNTSFAATQATASSLNATVVTTGGVAVAKDSSLSTINTTLGTPFQAGGSIGNTSFTATQGTGTNLHTVVDSGSISTTPVGGSTDSQTTGTVSTVITATAPSNAQGFILQNLQTSTANLRFAMGATATTSLGMQLAPGQDSGFVPTSANVSIVAESGTQNYNIQWVAK